MVALLLEILAALASALNLLSTINGIVQAVRAVLNLNDNTSWANKVLANTATSADLLNDSVVGLGAIDDHLVFIEAAIAALGNPMQAGSTVVLPPPPSGYGGSSAQDIWDFIEPGESRSQGYYVVVAGGLALNVGEGLQTELRAGFAGGWSVYGNWDNTNATEPSTFGLPPLDYSTVLETDATQYDWYARVYGDDWPLPNSSRGDNLQYDNGNGNFFWILTMTQTEFKAMQKARFGTATGSVGAPVWPGLDLVTLGDPVALSPGLTVTGPMHGVLVELTSVPTGRGKYLYDDVLAYLQIGALIFVSDNDDAEFIQALSLTDQVYCCKAMALATSCKVRAANGVTGTVTPWLINP